MKPLLATAEIFVSLVYLITLTESSGDWTPEFLSQMRKKSCILGHIEHDVTFLHGTDSGNFQKLGKVADMDVCVLLCCEMDNCEAAFMANRNCYAVKCHSQEHCVTAPARKNKWHPSVVFVKRINQSKSDKESQTAQAQNKQDEPATEHAQQATSAVHKDAKTQADQSKDDKDSQTAHTQNKQNGTSKEHALKEKTAVQKLTKNSEIPEVPSDKVDSKGIMSRLTIPVKDKPSVIRLAQEDTTKRKTIPLDKRKTQIREDMFKKSKYSLISAAVLTCSLAVVLSGAAVIAAKIRKRREAHQDPEYSSLPTVEE